MNFDNHRNEEIFNKFAEELRRKLYEALGIDPEEMPRPSTAFTLHAEINPATGWGQIETPGYHVNCNCNLTPPLTLEEQLDVAIDLDAQNLKVLMQFGYRPIWN